MTLPRRVPVGFTCPMQDQLTLTPLRVEDAEAMVSVLADPALYAFTGGEPPDLASLRRLYAHQVTGASPDGSQRWFNWIVRVDGEAVGYVQATVEDEVAELAWVIGAPWRARGLAARAARLMLHEFVGTVRLLRAHIHPDHHASNRIATGLGLPPTGAFEDGEAVWEGPLERA